MINQFKTISDLSAVIKELEGKLKVSPNSKIQPSNIIPKERRW